MTDKLDLNSPADSGKGPGSLPTWLNRGPGQRGCRPGAIAALLLAIATALCLSETAPAQSYEALHKFKGGDGANPHGAAATASRTAMFTVAGKTAMVTQSETSTGGLYDGKWNGTTSQGKAISFTIVNSAVSVFTVGYLTSVGPCTQDGSVTFTYSPPRPFTGSSFSIQELHVPGLSVNAAAIFDSSTSASGGAAFVYASGTCESDGSASWTATTSAPSTGFSGQVTDAATGAGIPGASVTWGSSSTTTDGSGNYALNSVPCQTNTLTVSKSGYQPFSQSYTPTCNASNVKNVTLMSSQTQQVTFDFTGSPQAWVVPDSVTSVVIDARGAQGGGNGDTPGAQGGEGGRLQTTLAVTPGETLVIYVGGRGGDMTGPNTAGPGGFNGGASGGIDNVDANSPGAGGGGSSDIRRGGDSLANRVVIAGGGGGAECCGDGNGGDGGGTTGMSGGAHGGFGSASPGGGGTQSNGGAGGVGCNGSGSSGSLEQGGVGGNGNRAGGGGGGGYYGGGGGGGCLYGAGGGGGSSYSAGSNTVHTQGFRTGAGQVVLITPMSTSPPGPFTLTGNAYCNTVPPAGPAATLSWTASSGASGYSVYRDGTLYASGVTQTSFDNNTNVTAGRAYTYSVRASNAYGNTDSNTISISVPSNLCATCSLICAATVPSNGGLASAVPFQGSATATSCAGGTTYDWDFGDGSAHSLEQNPRHVYAALGDYEWTMTTAAQGQTCTRSGAVAIQAPIVFVHGFCSDASTWDAMIPALQGMSPARYGTKQVDLYFDGSEVQSVSGGAISPSQVYTITFYNPDAPDGFAKEAVNQLTIQEEAHQLGRVVNEVMMATSATKVDLATHSMGGLVSRAYVEGLASHGTGSNEPFLDTVSRLVTIDTPHAGADGARWDLNPAFFPCQLESGVQKAQMTPGSSFLDLLNSQPVPESVSMLTAIASTYPLIQWDQVVDFSSQDITEQPRYGCSASAPNIETIENLVLLPCGLILHTCVLDLRQTAREVNSRIGAISVKRVDCQTVVAGTATELSPEGVVGNLSYRVDLSFSPKAGGAGIEPVEAYQVCTADVMARSETGDELIRVTVPADGFQSVNLGIITEPNWHVELLPGCDTTVSVTVVALPVDAGSRDVIPPSPRVSQPIDVGPRP